ncbi:BatA domain-containing protein [Xanthovirga aplysinae]|uniref:BatA domain-containing protein n=1 Tax=Xanthovirga aplysinae TaxID=2529853 RepID=UPI0012BCB40E|nr:BatA domain-containing protein [Xanthovirga aplysinae]MTI31825.1 hypothetical protein [Xanthovirga aplysinae]
MIFFTEPLYLFGLVGLAIPLLIHLWNQKKGKSIQIGSVRWLRGIESKKAKRLQLSQWWLLLLRCLILVLLSFIISSPFTNWFFSKPENLVKLALVDPQIHQEDTIKAKLVELKKEGFDIRWLSQGFPTIETPPKKDRIINYWSLLKEIDIKKHWRPDTIHVIGRSLIKNFRGKRPKFSFHVNWHLLFSEGNDRQLIELQSAGLDSLKAVFSNSSKNGTFISQQKYATLEKDQLLENANAGQMESPIKKRDWADSVVVVHSLEFEEDAQLIIAGFRAVSRYTGHSLVLNKVLEKDFIKEEIQGEGKGLVLLLEKPLKYELSMENNPFVLLYNKGKEDYGLKELIKHSPENGVNYFNLTRRLNSDSEILPSELPVAESLLVNFFTLRDAENRVHKLDQRGIDIQQVKGINKGLSKVLTGEGNKPKSLYPFLWVLMVILLTLERFVAVGKTI